ncbi:MAG: WD40 repeat domain-containing protein, partial [Alphaproteobacteria bacterium]|nr:WD40 repeat domain-containing protein [Alphaproteobacteria bacterium]
MQSAYVLASRTAAVRGQRLRVTLAIGVAIVAAGLSIWAIFERQVAERRYQESMSRQLTIEANRVLADDPDRLVLSVQLAAEAMRRVSSPEAADSLRAGLRLLPRLHWQTPMPTPTATGVAFTPDGAQIATADGVWHAASGSTAVAFAHEGRTTDLAVSLDGRLVARLGGGRLQLRERATGTPIALQAPARPAPVLELAFSRDGRRLAAVDQLHTLHVWDTSGALLRSLPPPEALSGPVRGLVFSPDGGVIAVARRQRVERWETSGWERLQPPLTMAAGAVAAIDYAEDGRLAAVASSRAVVVYGRDGATMASFRADEELERAEAIRFAPDGRHLAIAGKNRVQVVEAGSGDSVLLSRLGGRFAFASDSARLAIAGAGRTAHVLEVASGTELARLVHGADVTALAFAPGDSAIATLADDAALRLWDAVSAFPSASLRGDAGSFIDGGRHVVATGERQRLQLWSRE